MPHIISPLYIICIIFISLHLPSGVTSFAIQTPSSNTQQKIWNPPSQQQQKVRGNIFSIITPEEDLLDFIIEDDRLCVVKVYASWCTTCKKFDLRYRKIASQYGDKKQTDNNQRGQVRFAEMQYDKEENREICNVLNATSFPYIIMYKGSKGKIREFQCTPAKINLLVDAIKEELADDDSISDDNGLSQQVIELGLAGNR